MSQCILSSITMSELPVFEPNEYFWKTHWQEGKEEKWVAYARAIRSVIAEQGGFELIDATMEQKLDYKRSVKARAKSD